MIYRMEPMSNRQTQYESVHESSISPGKSVQQHSDNQRSRETRRLYAACHQSPLAIARLLDEANSKLDSYTSRFQTSEGLRRDGPSHPRGDCPVSTSESAGLVIDQSINCLSKDKPDYPKQIYYRYREGQFTECTSVFNELLDLCCSELNDITTVAIYYDNPNNSNGNCRWAVGVAPLNHDTKERLVAAGYSFITLPSIDNAVIVKFHLTTVLSIHIAVYRLFTLLSNYLKSSKLCGYPYVEVCHDSWMTVFAPLKKQQGFFVPQCHDEMYFDGRLMAIGLSDE